MTRYTEDGVERFEEDLTERFEEDDQETTMSGYAANTGTGSTSANTGSKNLGQIPTQTNDDTHVGLNPDAGRYKFQGADGVIYTAAPSETTVVFPSAGGSSTVNLIHEGV